MLGLELVVILNIINLIAIILIFYVTFKIGVSTGCATFWKFISFGFIVQVFARVILTCGQYIGHLPAGYEIVNLGLALVSIASILVLIGLIKFMKVTSRLIDHD